MIKTQILIEGNIRSKVRVKVKVRFILFYSELLPPFPLTLFGRKKYEEAISDKHPLNA